MGGCMNLMLRRRAMMSSGPKEQPNYLCFTALESGTFTLTINASVMSNILSYIEYSLDGKSWVRIDNVSNQAVTITTPTVSAGDNVYWRGSGQGTSNNINWFSNFSSSGKFDVSGNLLSLVLGKNCDTETYNVINCMFCKLFQNNVNLVNAKDLILPTKLANNIFNSTFSGCSSLITPPPLHSASLMQNCYNNMFRGAAFNVAPELNADVVPAYGYAYLFISCSNLTYIKCLATDISATSATGYWIYGIPNSASCIFVQHIDATWTKNNANGIPTKWTVIYYDPDIDKYYLDQQRQTECDDHGNPI